MLTETILCLALNIYYEARSEPLTGQIAITNVVLNRVEDERFPNSACEVITQKGQFVWYWQGRDYFPLKETDSWINAVKLATLMSQYPYKDITEGSVFYHVRGKHCNHAGKQIGQHIFLKDL